jgi:hypothetical protein
LAGKEYYENLVLHLAHLGFLLKERKKKNGFRVKEITGNEA